MEIEIVEYYPQPDTKKKNLKCGTMHVYVIDLGMDIRGIRFIKTKKGWVVGMPHISGLEDGKRVFYPVITFTDVEKMKNLITQIKEKGVAYIEKLQK